MLKCRKKEDRNSPIEEGLISCTLLHLGNSSYRLGRALQIDPEKGEVSGDEEAAHLLQGQERGYRAPYVLPKEV